METSGTIFLILAIIFVLSWFLLPFAIWGMQGRLKRIYSAQLATNELLGDAVSALNKLSSETEKALNPDK